MILPRGRVLRRWTGALLLGAAVGGCASRGAVERVHADLGEADGQLRILQLQVGAIDSLLRLQAREERRLSGAAAARGEATELQLQQVQARLDEIVRRLNDLADGRESQALYAGTAPAPATARADSATAAAPRRRLDANGLYEQALADLHKGDHAVAAAAFEEFLAGFPTSELADNAGYWLGECHYARRDFAAAAAAFQRVVADYPEGDKVPAALLKLGFALPEIKKKTKGIEALQQLVKRFPDSEEAALGRTRLKALGVRR